MKWRVTRLSGTFHFNILNIQYQGNSGELLYF